MRRIAIPVFETDVAPRFCFARRFLIADVEDDEVQSRSYVEMGEPGWRFRLTLLNRQGVSHLLCGGFNRTYAPFALGLGILVSWGHFGAVEQLLEQFCRGEVHQSTTTRSCGRRLRPRQSRNALSPQPAPCRAPNPKNRE
ncbi:MAG: hypothetical protein ABI333_23040 [bacterium]